MPPAYLSVQCPSLQTVHLMRVDGLPARIPHDARALCGHRWHSWERVDAAADCRACLEAQEREA
jgi:hypothetical protein